MQAKLILEKITTRFFDIYFTFLFIQIFVSHFPYVTFFLKSLCNFFCIYVRKAYAKYGLNSISVSQEKPFFSLIGLAIYPRPYLQLSAFTRILKR